MKVARETLAGTPIAQLRVVEAPNSDHHCGETVGYRCGICGQADETKNQIYHTADCELAGKHGREHYDEPPQRDDHPDCDPDHTLFMIRSADSEGDVARGNPVMWLCEACSNGDETAAEIIHDENCPLASS